MQKKAPVDVTTQGTQHFKLPLSLYALGHYLEFQAVRKGDDPAHQRGTSISCLFEVFDERSINLDAVDRQCTKLTER